MLFICPECNQKSFDKLLSLSMHYKKMHKKPSKKLYIDLFCNGIEPSCKCGCGEKPTFLNIIAGFRDYKLGHVARVKNNYQIDTVVAKSQATRKTMIVNGTFKPYHLKETGKHWGLGLTKETDERIARMAATINMPEMKLVKSERMRKNRLNGTVRTLKGKEHSQWKGGISSVGGVARNNKKLYTSWIYPKLCASKFSCIKCGVSNGKLEVHHDKQTFSEIVKIFVDKYNWKTLLENNNFNADCKELMLVKENISDEIAEYHAENNVSGLVLCKACHKKEHKSYNF